MKLDHKSDISITSGVIFLPQLYVVLSRTKNKKKIKIKENSDKNQLLKNHFIENLLEIN